jgi:hypothetical protein
VAESHPPAFPVPAVCSLSSHEDTCWSHAATYSIKERLFLKPSVGFYNIFNFSNFDLPSSTMSGLLAGTAGSINGTDPAAHNTNRVGVGSGVFTLGSPRQIEFSLKVIF